MIGSSTLETRHEATYEEILRLPAHLVGEILHGELVTHPRPAPKHAVAAASLGMEVGARYHRGRDGPGGWWILDEPELHLGPDIMVPDIAGWRRERMPTVPDIAWFDLAPDWVCEVLSPSTARVDRIVKMPIYARYSVRHLWLIDPDLRTLEAFELREESWTVIASLKDDEIVGVPPFDATDFALSALWT